MPSDAPVLHPQRKETSPFPPRPEVEQADAAINVPPLGPPDAAVREVAGSGAFPRLRGLAPNESAPTNVAWLYRHEEEFNPALREWCQSGLISSHFKTMEELESFARAAYQHIMARGLMGYNWDNEGPIPGPPYHADDNANPLTQQPGAAGDVSDTKFPPMPWNHTLFVSWLYDHEETFTVGFKSWCKLHLDAGADGPRDDMELFAQYAYNLYTTKPRDHDWDNEPTLLDEVDDGHESDQHPRTTYIPLKRRASSFHVEADQGFKRQRRVQSAPVRNSELPPRVAQEWQLQHPGNPFAWPVLPADPRPRTCLEWLYANRASFPRSFAKWCKWHLSSIRDGDFVGLDALESFADAAYVYWYGVENHAQSSYDWTAAETLFDGPPFLDLVPPVRNLHYLIRNEPQEAKDYFNRQLDNEAVDGADVPTRAVILISDYRDPRNIGRNWALEPDVIRTANPSTSVTSRLPLQGTRGSAHGHWMVSTFPVAISFHDCQAIADVIDSSSGNALVKVVMPVHCSMSSLTLLGRLHR
jgi:hypothetical protein